LVIAIVSTAVRQALWPVSHIQTSSTTSKTGGETRCWTRGIFIKVYLSFTSCQKIEIRGVPLDLYRRSNLGRREEKLSWFSSVPPGRRRNNIFTGPQPLNCKLIIHQSSYVLEKHAAFVFRVSPGLRNVGRHYQITPPWKRENLAVNDLQTQGQLQSRELCVLQARVLCI